MLSQIVSERSDFEKTFETLLIDLIEVVKPWGKLENYFI